MVATFLFLITILGVTRKGTPVHIAGLAGLAIGLTLAVIHIVGINVTGVSVNPARSLGPALFVGGNALAQLWLFIVAPLVGAGAAGLLYKSGALWGRGIGVAAFMEGGRRPPFRPTRSLRMTRPGVISQKEGEPPMLARRRRRATGSPGVTSGSKRATTVAVRSTRNFSKFQRTSPSTGFGFFTAGLSCRDG